MNCPKCTTPLPTKRLAATWGQRLLGGHVCPRCHTVLNRQGNELLEDYNTPAATVLFFVFFAGLLLSNYLSLDLGRPLPALLVLLAALALQQIGVRVLQPKARDDAHSSIP